MKGMERDVAKRFLKVARKVLDARAERLEEKRERIKALAGETGVLLTLVEECAEVQQAALKCLRAGVPAIGEVSPTDVEFEDAARALSEELDDLQNALFVLLSYRQAPGDEDKLDRWLGRLEAARKRVNAAE